MRLDELTGVKHLYDKQLVDLMKVMTQPGSKFQKAGRGSMAQVFSHEDGSVYKFWVKDDPYEKYIDYCLDHQDNPHIPVLLSPVKILHTFFTRPKKFPDVIKYVKMEPLKSLKDDQIWPGILHRGAKVTYEEIFNKLEEFKSMKDAEKQLFIDLKVTAKAKKEILDVFKIIQDLKKITGPKAIRLDLHGGNIMLRGDTIVISDPLVNNKSIGFNQELEDMLYDLQAGALKKKKIKIGPSSVKKDKS